MVTAGSLGAMHLVVHDPDQFFGAGIAPVMKKPIYDAL